MIRPDVSRLRRTLAERSVDRGAPNLETSEAADDGQIPSADEVLGRREEDDVEDVVDEAEKVLRGRFDLAGPLVGDVDGEAADGGERCTQLVRHVGEELGALASRLGLHHAHLLGDAQPVPQRLHEAVLGDRCVDNFCWTASKRVLSMIAGCSHRQDLTAVFDLANEEAPGSGLGHVCAADH